ncbi:relaxase [uncultured Alistipes sp.]|uniref:relaxase n=1 Tax=uncultured Alistipes sp. TaxID=538949 RepID=UPI0025F91679|nr:relaxase [uncultured Alistipes sp.]
MIAKAKAISHGINDLRYITGESQHKKHPEKIYRVLDNLLPSEPDAMGIWNSMQLTLSQHRPIKNSVIRIELSPSPEHTQFYDIEDWQNLWQEFAEEFDKLVITGKDGKVRSRPTNLAGSKYSVWLHTESKGEVPHLHAAVCRLDENGNINNDHNIHLRAQRAAERVAKKRGWMTAAQIRNSNILQVNRDCMEVLKAMPSWSWDEYKNALIRKGYTVHEREDKKGILHGYALVNGNTKYKASELGVGRNLMISKLPATWNKLHYKSGVTTLNSKPEDIKPKHIQKPSASNTTRYNTYRSDTVPYTLNQEGKEHQLYIPGKVLDCFNDEFDYRFVANCHELTDMAVAIFVGLFDTPNVATGGGGGGSQSDLPWRDKNEDDLQWARRCARAASRSLGKKPKTGLKR